MSDQPVELSVTVSQLPANIYYNPVNDHYYQLVTGAYTWSAAKTAAETAELFGMHGYLATITSQQENAFIANYTDTSNIWIGASDDTGVVASACDSKSAQPLEGHWYWVTGPDACPLFWSNDESYPAP